MMKRERQRYEKPVIKFVEIDLNSCIAVRASTYPGDNKDEAWGGNSYQNKDITVNEDINLSGTWDSGWNNRDR